jgi:hypothetical protein
MAHDPAIRPKRSRDPIKAAHQAFQEILEKLDPERPDCEDRIKPPDAETRDPKRGRHSQR